jgi:flagellar assembly protein FliH
MSETDAAPGADVSRWDLPAVEGSPMPRIGAGVTGVNVMHLAAVERDAWEQGYKSGQVEGVRKGEAEFAKRIAEVDVKVAALEAIIGTLARPLEELDTQVETELTRLALSVAKHLVRRELKIDPAQIIGIIRHTLSLLPLSARNIKIHLHPDDAAIVRDKLAAPRGDRGWELAEDPLMARGGCRLTTDNSSIDARFEASVTAALTGLLGDDRVDRPQAGAVAAPGDE